jgi:WD40 repeat protein/tetratricopeptide (TPR) repeat protein
MNDQPATDPSSTIGYVPTARSETVPPRDTPASARPPASPTVSLQTNNLPAEIEATLIPGYEMLGELGRGGMGVVYKARQVGLNRVVALKMILAGPHAGGPALARFRAEAAAIAQLQHPNIVQVYEIGEHDGRPFFSLEMVEGGSLAQRIAGTPQPPSAAAQLVEVVARAIHLAHEAGIVHRDLKPANILLQPDARPQVQSNSSRSLSRSLRSGSTEYGTPKVSDFGLAKHAGSAHAGMTHTGSIMGTPSYMSPEQAMGNAKAIGPPTDVYALGAILYELLTGRPPFRADSPLNTVMAVVKGEPVPPSRLQPKLPRDLETITLKCLEKPPAKRYPSALHLADDLQRFIDGLPITARPAGAGERLVKWAMRRPTLAALVATVILALTALIAGGIWAYAAVTHRAADAERAHADAAAAVEVGRQRLVRLSVANGSRQLDSGDLLGSLLWFADALRLDQDEPAATAVHRKRIGAVLEMCPRLHQAWVHEGPVNCVAFSPDGRFVLTGGADGIARLWDATTGKPASVPLEHGGPVTFAPISPDGRQALTGGPDGYTHLWDLATGRRVGTFGGGAALSGVLFHPDGRRIVLAARAGGLRFWNCETGQQASSILPNDGMIETLSFSPDGKILVVAGEGGTVRFWDTATYAAAAPTLKLPAAVHSICVSPDGRRVATACADGSAQVWDVHSGDALLARPLQHRGSVNKVAFSPDGKWLVTAANDKSAQVWDLSNGVRIGPPMTHGSKVTDVSFSPDGRWVATLSDDNTARVWDAASSQPVSPVLRHIGTPTALTFSPDGRGVLTASQDRLARFWVLRAPAAPPKTAARMVQTSAKSATSPDGRLIVTFGGEPYARVRSAADHEPVSPPLRHNGPVTAALFSPDSTWVLTAGADGVVQAWDAETGKARWEAPPRHASKVYAVTISPNGTRVATAGDDNTAWLVDAATGKPTVTPIRHDGGIFHVAFGAAGDTLFTASLDGSSRVWDVTTGEPLTPPLPAWSGQAWQDTLPTDGRPVADLVALAQVLTGLRIDETGGRSQLAPAALRDRWAKLREQYPNDFAPVGTVSDWHAAQADASEGAGQWFAAAWHLAKLAAATPDRADVRRRLARAFGEQGAWESAAAAATGAITLDPGDREAWQQRGMAHGEMKHWDAAVADLTQAYALTQEPQRRIALMALLPLAAGDRDGYRRVCRELLNQHGTTDDMSVALWVASACVLTPDAVADWAPVVRLAEKAVTDRPRSAAALTTFGAALLRAGRADEADAQLRSAVAIDGDAPLAALYLALADRKRGQNATAGRPAANTGPLSWQQQEELKVLRAELGSN